MSETVSGFKNQAKTFKALQKILQQKGDFQSTLMAAVCSGLAEVAEGLSEIEVAMIKKRKVILQRR